MSNAARKARKQSGEKFTKAQKVGTPLLERSIPDVQKKVKNMIITAPSNSAQRRIDKRVKFLAQFND